jgi:AcrR family transcriptional regulator
MMGNGVEKKTRRCSEEANQARCEEILETATALFAEQGFSDAVTQALAERLGVGKGTIYRHFPSKRALFLAATDRVMRKLQDRVTANVAGIEDGLERLERGIATFLQFFADHPSFVELLIQERAYFKDRKRPTYFEHREVNIQRWKQLYRDLMAAGRMREMPVERITTVISNVLYGIMVTNFFNGQPAPADVQAREILDIIFLGVLSEPERRRVLGERAGTAGAANREPAAAEIESETHSATSGNGISGGGPFGGANGHGTTMVDAPVGAVAGGDGDGLSAGAIGAGEGHAGRRV